jgi:ribonucleoside-diphosphate reductase beta chain
MSLILEHHTVLKSNDENEILLTKDSNRFVMFPIKYHDIYQKYLDAQGTFWTAEEIQLEQDEVDWIKLTENENYFIKNIIGFFAGSDGIVNENLATRFQREIEIPEARAFYTYQSYNETIHSITYSLLIDTYIKDKDEKERILNSIENIPCVAEKAAWAYKWIENKEVSFATRLIAFAIVEGIFFSGSFCAIYWLKKRGLMPGLTFSNELISRDEGLHCEFACLLYSKIKNRLDEDIVYQIMEEAVTIEKSFINDSLPCALIGMNKEMMSQYIEFVADRLLVQLGYDKRWKVENPFEFMELISLRPKTNFFEKKVGEYKKSTISKTTKTVEIDDDF